VRESQITANTAWVAKWKVLIPAASDGNEIYPLPIWDQVGPFIARPHEVCSETYIVASLASTKAEAEAIVQYMRTKFFRFMVSLRKVAQHNKADNFSFVPDLPLDRTWTDRDLYRRFSLTEKEIEHIESNIREMTYGDE
jgi:site-specific DNA-methyltransferase (adenine-specific)